MILVDGGVVMYDQFGWHSPDELVSDALNMYTKRIQMEMPGFAHTPDYEFEFMNKLVKLMGDAGFHMSVTYTS